MSIMIAVTTHKAKTQLSSLIKRAEAGEDIVILRGHHPAARLTATKRDRRSLRPKVGTISSAPVTYTKDCFKPLTRKQMEAWGFI